jgi:hypothetical protein
MDLLSGVTVMLFWFKLLCQSEPSPLIWPLQAVLGDQPDVPVLLPGC